MINYYMLITEDINELFAGALASSELTPGPWPLLPNYNLNGDYDFDPVFRNWQIYYNLNTNITNILGGNDFYILVDCSVPYNVLLSVFDESKLSKTILELFGDATININTLGWAALPVHDYTKYHFVSSNINTIKIIENICKSCNVKYANTVIAN